MYVSHFFSVTVTYSYLLIFYDILVFTMYKKHVRSCLPLLLNSRYAERKQMERLYIRVRNRKVISAILNKRDVCVRVSIFRI